MTQLSRSRLDPSLAHGAVSVHVPLVQDCEAFHVAFRPSPLPVSLFLSFPSPLGSDFLVGAPVTSVLLRGIDAATACSHLEIKELVFLLDHAASSRCSY